jgi:AraC family L-rhamnose operon regulatory protein RhaS
MKIQAVIDLKARSPVLPRFPSYGLCILESRHIPGFRMPPSRYDFWEVMLVIEGRGWVVQNETRHPLQPRDVVVVPAGTTYHLEDSPDAPLANTGLCIRPTPALESLFAPLLPKDFWVHRGGILNDEAAFHLRAILFEQSRPTAFSEAIVIAQALMLLSKLARRERPHEGDLEKPLRSREIELLARVREYVEQLETRFHESETIETVGGRLGMSSKSLTSYFRQVTGVSRQRYIQRLRLDHACRLLDDPEQSVASIAFACGFEDLSTFFRAFRLEKKMSPGQWRKR